MKLVKLYIILLLAGLISCKNKTALEERPAEVAHSHEQEVGLTDEQEKNAGIELGSLETRPLSGVIKANGMLDVPPQNLVSVTTPLSGILQETELLQGMKVKKGQVIAVLKSQEYIQLQQDYLENRSRLEYLQADYERQQQLAKENVNAQKTLQQAKSEFETTLAKQAGIKAKLQLAGVSPKTLEKGEITPLLIITSPINGYVTQVHVALGAMVMPGTEMFRIVDTQHLHAEIRVFERDLTRIKVGNTVFFNVTHETEKRQATVYLIGREIEADRTVRIHCHLEKEDTELIPGMYISATVETQSSSVPVLPDAAIASHEGKNYIFVYKEAEKSGSGTVHHYAMQEVTTGITGNGYTEIVSPENLNNKKIVVRGAFILLTKMFNTEDEGGHGH